MAVERASRLAAISAKVGARSYACAASRFTAEAALARGRGIGEAAAKLAQALGALDAYPAPLESWKSRRMLGLLRRRQGEEAGARHAFSAAAADVDVIARGVDDKALREGFLASPGVREVLEEAGRARPRAQIGRASCRERV